MCVAQIPIALFGITHAYFCLYHALSNLLIRRTLAEARARGFKFPWIAAGVVIFLLAYVTAFMETFTIAHVCPHLLFFFATQPSACVKDLEFLSTHMQPIAYVWA